MVSINAALQIDLTGQVAAEAHCQHPVVRHRRRTDYAYGAYHSKGGRAMLCQISTAKKGTVSRIAPILDPGSIVSVSRNLTDMVITEYGVAKLRARTVKQRVENLIAVAHPDFRCRAAEGSQQAHVLLIRASGPANCKRKTATAQKCGGCFLPLWRPLRAPEGVEAGGPEPTEAPGRGPQGPLPGACRKGGSQMGLGRACWAAGTAVLLPRRGAQAVDDGDDQAPGCCSPWCGRGRCAGCSTARSWR